MLGKERKTWVSSSEAKRLCKLQHHELPWSPYPVGRLEKGRAPS